MPVLPLSEHGVVRDATEAYAVQQTWSAFRRQRDEQILGCKIGLTACAIQQQLGVHEPDYGELWSRRFYPLQDGRVDIPAAPFL